jgi:hypothetical protein
MAPELLDARVLRLRPRRFWLRRDYQDRRTKRR